MHVVTSLFLGWPYCRDVSMITYILCFLLLRTRSLAAPGRTPVLFCSSTESFTFCNSVVVIKIILRQSMVLMLFSLKSQIQQVMGPEFHV